MKNSYKYLTLLSISLLLSCTDNNSKESVTDISSENLVDKNDSVHLSPEVIAILERNLGLSYDPNNPNNLQEIDISTSLETIDNSGSDKNQKLGLSLRLLFNETQKPDFETKTFSKEEKEKIASEMLLLFNEKNYDPIAFSKLYPKVKDAFSEDKRVWVKDALVYDLDHLVNVSENVVSELKTYGTPNANATLADVPPNKIKGLLEEHQRNIVSYKTLKRNL